MRRDIFNIGSVAAFNLGDGRDVFVLDAFAFVIAPFNNEIYPSFSSANKAKIDTVMSGKPMAKMDISFGALLCWASRRPEGSRQPEWFLHEIDGSKPRFSMAPFCDSQHILGTLFNRRLVREVLQAFVEEMAGADEKIVLDLIATTDSLGSEGKILRIQRDRISCGIMCLRGGPRGSDPLPWPLESSAVRS